jgi:hypothetical protein
MKKYKEWLEAVKLDHNALPQVPKELWTVELCLEAVKKDYSALNYIPREYLTREICLYANKQSSSAIKYVQKDLLELYSGYVTEENEKTKYNFNVLENIINIPINQFNDFRENFQQYIADINKIKKNYNIVDNINFNIFTSVSDKYHWENYHSDIIRYLLDSNTPKIGNNEFIKIFFGFIDKIEPKVKINLSGNIQVKREKYRIDIFLFDDKKNGVIIENKINGAIDQKDQLGGYYTKRLDEGYKIDTIIYLTLTPKKDIDIERSVLNESTRSKILKKLKKVSVINYKNEPSFAIDFIDKCVELSDNDVQRVYLSEYSELVKYLGGTMMSNGIDKKVLIDIYGDKEKFNTFKIFADLWERKNGLLFEIIKEKLIEKLKFIEYPEKNSIVYKCVGNDIFIALDESFSFGFFSPKKKIKGDLRKELQKVFEEYFSNDRFFCEGEIGNEDIWVYKNIDPDGENVIEETISKFKYLKSIVGKNKSLLTL